MKSWWMLWGAALAIAAGSAEVRAQTGAQGTTELSAEAREKTFIEAVKAKALPLRISASGLSGGGADWLVKQAATAQFALIGEDHGFADVPQFAQGLQASLGEARFEHMVLELGFHATQRIEQALCEGPDGLDALNRRFPFFSPFVNFREDGALAASFVACGGKGSSLWGIDQEFLLSSQLHLHRLQQLATRPEQRKSLAAFQAQADQAWTTMVTEHEPGSIALMQWNAADFARLRGLFDPARDREALELVEAMAASADIYNGQNSDGYRSNRARSVLMKSLFMRSYRAAQAGPQDRPRALFKLGAYHAARGLTPTQQFDIGNMASELAESNGGRSLHVLVLMGGGEVNQHFPFSADDKDRRVVYDARKELKTLGIDALLAVAPAEDAVVVDLQALREADGVRMPSGSAINRLIYNYDAVVLVAKGHPATNY